MDSDIRRRLWHTLIIGSSFSGLSYLFTFHKSFLSRITGWFQWSPTSPDLLEQAEQKLLSYVKKPINLQFLKIDSFDGIKEECNIRTLIMNHELASNSTPLVLLHGFASGIGLWILNLEDLTENRPVYALDLLGFGRSSRPPFSKDPEIAEHQFVESIEQWRKQTNLEYFILLGHSMGGYLATSYAIKYPHRVKHLILADPWGFPESDLLEKKIVLPLWVKFIASLLRPFNPLAGLRVAGPWGPQLVQRFRPDILGKFDHFVEDTSDISNYIYHCNSQTPSGEAAFKSMTAQFGWAKRPMLKRISELSPEISITFIYGSKSWIDSNSGAEATRLLPNSSVEIKMILGAGHHVYADRASEFNSLVCDTCFKVDQGVYSDPSQKNHISKIPHNQQYTDEDIEADTIPA